MSDKQIEVDDYPELIGEIARVVHLNGDSFMGLVIVTHGGCNFTLTDHEDKENNWNFVKRGKEEIPLAWAMKLKDDYGRGESRIDLIDLLRDNKFKWSKDNNAR